MPTAVCCTCVENFLYEQFTEKRRELKFDGRLEKELSESYAFLMVDQCQVRNETLQGKCFLQQLRGLGGLVFFSVFIDTIFKLLLQNSALEGMEGWERDLVCHHLNPLFPAT